MPARRIARHDSAAGRDRLDAAVLTADARFVAARHRHVADLAGNTHRTSHDVPGDHGAGGEAGADAEIGQAADAELRAELLVRTERCRVDVVLDPHGHVQACAEVVGQGHRSVDADVERHRDHAVADAARDPDADRAW